MPPLRGFLRLPPINIWPLNDKFMNYHDKMMKGRPFNNREEIKTYFRKRVKEIHPDKGGNIDDFLSLYNWYKRALTQSHSDYEPRIVKLNDSHLKSGNSFFKTQRFTIKEISLGLEKELILPFNERRCPSCKGSGLNRERRRQMCPYCNGTGVLKLTSQHEEITHCCTFCGGHGYLHSEKCSSCFGKGKIKEEMPFKVKLPYGLRDGDLLFISGETLGVKWNFYIEVEVEPHPLWRLIGDDIICQIKVPFHEILLREYIEVETLEGVERVPASHFVEGEPVVFPGRGPYIADESHLKRGNFVIHLTSVFPKTLPSEAKGLIHKLRQLIEGDNKC